MYIFLYVWFTHNELHYGHMREEFIVFGNGYYHTQHGGREMIWYLVLSLRSRVSSASSLLPGTTFSNLVQRFTT